MKYLLIAEKNSLERAICEVANKHKDKLPYELHTTTQRGHLYTLKLPRELEPLKKGRSWDNLPFYPDEHGGYKYKVIKEKKVGNFLTAEDRVRIIKKELSFGKYDAIIHAGDPDREGQLLVDITLNELNNTLPIKRFWTNDLTEKAILNELLNLHDYKDPFMQNLLCSAYSRQKTDYCYGMNISEACSLKMNDNVSAGRVKSFILRVVCQRELAIKNFKPSTCYGVSALYDVGFKGSLFNKPTEKSELDAEDKEESGIVWFDTEKEAKDFISTLSNDAKVVSCEKKKVSKKAPSLYRLATAQIDGEKLGYTDGQVLEIIQSLYDPPLCAMSYPRTSCEFLSSNENFRAFLDSAAQVPSLAPFVATITDEDIERVKKTKAYVNDEALKEAGHSALRPTESKVDFNKLTKPQQDIYEMVCKRFVAIFLPPLVQEKTTIVTQIEDAFFKSTGKVLVSEGYSKLFSTKNKDTVIPLVKVGDVLHVSDFEVPTRTSTCPKHLTSNDIIAICDNPAKYLEDESLKTIDGHKLKVGTDATRSGIIKTLINRDKYLTELKEGKKKVPYIVPTQKGYSIDKNLKDCKICKPDMTGSIEYRLNLIAKGELTAKEYEMQMKEDVRVMVEDIKNTNMESITNSMELCSCPVCSGTIISGRKAFFCSNFKDELGGCKVGMAKLISGATITDKDFLSLVEGNSIVKTMKKDTNTWKQEIRFADGFKGLEFVRKQIEQSSLVCPKCHEPLMESEGLLFCSNKDTCDFKLYKQICKVKLDEECINALLKGEQTKVVDGFISKSNKKFSASLKYDKDFNKIEFVFPGQEEREIKALDIECPLCGKGIINNGYAYTCSCGFKCSLTICGRPISVAEITQICGNSSTKEVCYGFTSKKGRQFAARLVLDRENKGVAFDYNN